LGTITPQNALICGIGGLTFAVLLSLLLNWFTATVVFIAAILMIIYETRLKQRGFVGNIVIAALTGMIFLFGGCIVGDMSRTWIPALLAVLVSIGREIAKDIEDADSDIGARTTLPMKIGVKKSASIAAAFFVAGPVLSFYPLIAGLLGWGYLTVLIPDIIFIYCAVIVFKNAHGAEKYAKTAMVVALVSFIMGVM